MVNACINIFSLSFYFLTKNPTYSMESKGRLTAEQMGATHRFTAAYLNDWIIFLVVKREFFCL